MSVRVWLRAYIPLFWHAEKEVRIWELTILGRGANTATPVPIYLCAALYIVMAIVAAAFPYEPMGKRSS